MAAAEERVTTGTSTPLESLVPVMVVKTGVPWESVVVNVEVIMGDKGNWVEGKGFVMTGDDVETGSEAVFCGAGGNVGAIIGGNPLKLVVVDCVHATPPGPTTIAVGNPSTPVVVIEVTVVKVVN